MRHALPEAVLLSLFAGFAVHFALATTSKLPKVLVALAFVAAAVSALPVLRPYEYYNELVGGTSQAYLWFNDEGIDIGMREKELAAYYHQVLEPAGELPLLQYMVFEQEQKHLKLDWIGRDPKRDARFFENKMFTGTIFVEARHLGPRLCGDLASFRAAQPVKRFGNALVYRGTFDISPLLAEDRYVEGLNQLNVLRDSATAEKTFRLSAELDPTSFWTFIELGDIYLTQGNRAQAVRAFQDALAHAPANTVFSRELEAELQLLAAKPLAEVPSLRDPALE
jgi:hypothetical protein